MPILQTKHQSIYPCPFPSYHYSATRPKITELLFSMGKLTANLPIRLKIMTSVIKEFVILSIICFNQAASNDGALKAVLTYWLLHFLSEEASGPHHLQRPKTRDWTSQKHCWQKNSETFQSLLNRDPHERLGEFYRWEKWLVLSAGLMFPLDGWWINALQSFNVDSLLLQNTCFLSFGPSLLLFFVSFFFLHCFQSGLCFQCEPVFQL